MRFYFRREVEIRILFEDDTIKSMQEVQERLRDAGIGRKLKRMKTMIGKVSHNDLMWGDSSDCLL